MFRGIVHQIAGPRNLNKNVEAHRSELNAVDDFFEVVVGRQTRDRLVGQIIIAKLGNNAIAAEFGLAGGIGKAKRCDAVVGLARKTRREWLGCLNESQGGRCDPRKSSIGLGEGTSGPLAAAARKNSRNSYPSRPGKPSVEWLTMSVWTCSARLNRRAKPRGLASGLLSGIMGKPVELEKRAVTGVDSPDDVRGFGEELRIGRRGKGSVEQKTLGMSRTESCVKPEESIELLEQIVGECNDTFILRERHRGESSSIFAV